MSRYLISRRTVLRGLGASLALPYLDIMGPLTAHATESEPRTIPNRMAFIYVPNGKNMPEWTPAAEGADFELPSIMQPLKEVKDHLLVLTGLTADKARPNGDGPGDHARALAAYLTGSQPRKTDGTDIRVGISVDQVAAGRIGDQTRLPSLEIGCERGGMAGNCDSGYSCVYSSCISWRSATTPLPKEVDPKLVFERLFGSGPDALRAKRDADRVSILDFVKDDTNSLKTRLGSSAISFCAGGGWVRARFKGAESARFVVGVVLGCGTRNFVAQSGHLSILPAALSSQVMRWAHFGHLNRMVMASCRYGISRRAKDLSLRQFGRAEHGQEYATKMLSSIEWQK